MDLGSAQLDPPRGRSWWRRPDGIVEGTRWLMAALALLSLLVCLLAALPHALAGWLDREPLLAIVAAVILTVSNLAVYRRRRCSFVLDLLDAVAIVGLALACPEPSAAFAYVFSALWFHALYGTTAQSLIRCGLYASAMVSTIPLWTVLPLHSQNPALIQILGALPTMFVTVIVARQLGFSLIAREQSLRRDAVLTTLGAELLGVTEPAAVRDLGWAASIEICAATPALRLLAVTRHGNVLRVAGAAGDFAAVPPTLPDGVLLAEAATRADTPPDLSILDTAAGALLTWSCIAIGHQQDSWLLVGAPAKSPGEALTALRGLASQVIMALRNSEVHQELTVLGRVDSLTGLANRAWFVSELADHLADRRRGPSLHLLFLDLDDFKDVNDVLGHRAGDALLIEVAARLRRCTRSTDLCARLGGDEFAVILGSSTAAHAEQTAQRIVDSIGEPVHLVGGTARVGVSIGITRHTPGISTEELVHQADVAMYAAKANGKGRIQVFTPGLLQANSARIALERELVAATAADQFVVHYQPVLSLPDLRCIAVEALVRWQHPTRGLLEPGQFIQTAERSGAIIDIGTFVLGRSCADVLSWRDADPGSAVAVHVNVSARELGEDRFIDHVRQCLADVAIPPEQLVLELTETVVLNSPAAIARLTSLAALGVRIAIDDFGTGYSSLTTLRSLPVDIVKLDTSFTAGAVPNSLDRTVIKAVVEMSGHLGLHTIAEGVERTEQQDFLTEIGADAVQGRLYLPPVSAIEMSAWLRHNHRHTRRAADHRHPRGAVTRGADVRGADVRGADAGGADARVTDGAATALQPAELSA